MKIKVYNPSNLKVIEYTKLEDFQGNLKIITKESLEKLKKSIIKYGFVIPKFVWINEGRYYILDGHQSKKALIELEKDGYEIPLIPYCQIQAENKKKAKEILLLINSRYGEMTESGLYDYIVEEEIDFKELITEINYPEIDNDEFINKYFNDEQETEGDDDIPEEAEPITKKGDLIELGMHRLLCGDATIKEDVDRLMDGKNGDMVFTDPPYGIDIVQNKRIRGDNKITFGQVRGKIGADNLGKAGLYKPVINDDKPFDPKFLLKFNKKMILWGANNYASKLPDNAHWIVWNKRVDSINKNFFSDCELAWTNINQKSVKRYDYTWSGMTRRGNRNDELNNRIHPTQKPVGLFANILNDYSKEKQLIIDLFLGSGSTLIACEKTGRICYGMEIDEYYCDIIIQRYKDWCNKNNIKCIIKRNGKLINNEKRTKK